MIGIAHRHAPLSLFPDVSVNTSTALCILGVHRSGTSTVTRALSLLGAYLGPEAALIQSDSVNPEGYWERLDIFDFHERLLGELNLSWDTAMPPPPGWEQSTQVRPFREELKRLIMAEFDGKPLWAWKDPRTCLLLPLWRSVLQELGIHLLNVFVVRSPLDVGRSLKRRQGIPLKKGYGIWFNYTLTALRESVDIPLAVVSYDRFLESWEAELRKCADALRLEWPENRCELNRAMNSFVCPQLRHWSSNAAELRSLPDPVHELYLLLLTALQSPERLFAGFGERLNRLARDHRSYASFFEADVQHRTIASRRGHSQSELDMGFVVSTSSELEQTDCCLKHLSAAGVPDSNIVIVAKEGSEQAPSWLAGRLGMRVISGFAHEGPGKMWNEAAQELYANWLVFLTSSVLVTPGFCEGLTAFIRERHRDVVSPGLGNGVLDYPLLSFSRTFVGKMNRSFRRGVAWPSVFMVDRRVFCAIGWFDAQGNSAETVAISFFRLAAQAGFRLAVTGKAFAHRVLRHDASPLQLGGTFYHRTRVMLCRWAESRRFGMSLSMCRDRGRWRSL